MDFLLIELYQRLSNQRLQGIGRLPGEARNEKGGRIGWDHMDSKSMQPGATPGPSAILMTCWPDINND